MSHEVWTMMHVLHLHHDQTSLQSLKLYTTTGVEPVLHHAGVESVATVCQSAHVITCSADCKLKAFSHNMKPPNVQSGL